MSDDGQPAPGLGYRRGPVLLRGQQIPKTTSDQRLLSGGDGARMRAMIDDFNASQRGVRVVSTTLKWGEPFYTKLITSSVVGEGPDIATVHLSRLPNLAGGGVLLAHREARDHAVAVALLQLARECGDGGVIGTRTGRGDWSIHGGWRPFEPGLSCRILTECGRGEHCARRPSGRAAAPAECERGGDCP